MNTIGIKSESVRYKVGSGESVVVYIILTHYSTYYTGITNNLIRRWKEHCKGHSSYLRKFTPKEVVYIELFPNRKLAYKKEQYIKRFGARKYLIFKRFK